MELYITIISNVITAIGTLGLGKFFLTRYERKHQRLENESFEGEEWKKLYEEQKTRADEWEKKADDKISKMETLYVEITKQRDEKSKMQNTILALSIKAEKLDAVKCLHYECCNRKPPSTKLNRLMLNGNKDLKTETENEAETENEKVE